MLNQAKVVHLKDFFMANKISIWKDSIILNWDFDIGSAPADAVKTPEDILYFWEHIGNIARWNQKLNAFLLPFSKQNMIRIHKQFGQIPVSSGMSRITELKQKQAELVKMIHMAETIKNAPFEKLPVYNYKAPPLAEYQHRATVMACNIKKYPLFADPGLGKTKIILDSIQRHKDLGIVPNGKTIIAVKLPTIRTGWLEDAVKFTNLKLVNLWIPQCKNRRERLTELLNTPADAYVINHEGILVLKEELVRHQFAKVVIDESTILKGYHGDHKAIKGGQFGRAITEVAQYADWRVIMSGTPAPNSILDLWGQFKFLDPDGLLLEPSFNNYRETFMTALDLRQKANQWKKRTARDPVKWIPKPTAFTDVGKIINPLAFRAKIRDHLKDLPALTKSVREIRMTFEQLAAYEDMKKFLMVEIDETRISVELALTKLLKLRQITGGFIIDHKEEVHPLESNPKISELDYLLNEVIPEEEKVVIYAQYQYEIELIKNRYKDFGVVSVFGKNSSKTNLDNIDKFIKDPSIKVIILHPKSMAHGVTLTVSHYMIFFSISHSAEDNFQCVARIERASQKHPMFVYYLLCANSIDFDMYNTVILKNINQSKVIDTDLELISTWRKNAAKTTKD